MPDVNNVTSNTQNTDKKRSVGSSSTQSRKGDSSLCPFLLLNGEE